MFRGLWIGIPRGAGVMISRSEARYRDWIGIVFLTQIICASSFPWCEPHLVSRERLHFVVGPLAELRDFHSADWHLPSRIRAAARQDHPPTHRLLHAISSTSIYSASIDFPSLFRKSVDYDIRKKYSHASSVGARLNGSRPEWAK